MENKKQTAVEWLASELSGHLAPSNGPELLAIINQAKAMEKEQIIEAHDEARIYVLKNVWKHDDGIRYYENKYGAQDNGKPEQLP